MPIKTRANALSEQEKADIIEHQSEALRRIRSQALPYGVLIAVFPALMDPLAENGDTAENLTQEDPETAPTLTEIAGDISGMAPNRRALEERLYRREHPDAQPTKRTAEAPPPLTGRAVILYAGKLIEVSLPNGLDIAPGDGVRLNPATSQIVGRALIPLRGEVAIVGAVLADGFCEIGDDPVRLVRTGTFTGTLKEGDRIVLDPSGTIVVAVLPPHAPFSTEYDARFTWNDIIGQRHAIQKLRGIVEYPHTHRELYAAYGRKTGTGTGVLIKGRPGNGKTMLAEAIANGLRAIHGAERVAGGYFYVSGAEFLESLVGLGEKRIRMLYAAAKEFFTRTGIPPVIVIDECEVVAKKRGTGKSSDASDPLLTTLLTEMNGVGTSPVITILITNRPEMLDPAITRDKRIDIKVSVDAPEPGDVPMYFEKYFAGVVFATGVTKEAAVTAATAEFLSDTHLYFTGPLIEGGADVKFTLKDLVSGALLAGIADEVVRIALARDIEANASSASGVTLADITAAVRTKFEEQKGLDLSDAIVDFRKRYRSQIAGETPQRQTTGK